LAGNEIDNVVTTSEQQEQYEMRLEHEFRTELRRAGGLSRRAFLAWTGALGAMAALGKEAVAGPTPRFSRNPFSLGVASGDPDQQSVVLWTRLAPEPFQPGGGMPAQNVAVAWQIADDEAMKSIVASGTAVATPQLGHAVHVEPQGLRADRWYFYQFRAGGIESPKGRTRTLPAAGSLPERLRFAFASCQNFESGHYTAYAHMAREDLDLVVHLGDYIYEGAAHRGRPRLHNSGEIFTLEDYRLRYALYKSDPALRAAHAAAPWVVTWDDHELANNYAGDIPEKPASREEFLRRRAAAYQAYYEMMPLRRAQLPSGPDLLLFRALDFGRLATFHVLDTRQYRTDQPQGDGRKPPSPVLLDPRGTMLGERQRAWLDAGLGRSAAAWNVLAQQVMMGLVSFPPAKPKDGAVADASATRNDERRYSMDQWGGYVHERAELLRFLAENKVANPVVLTGDIHANFVNELRVDDADAKAPIVATEFVGTSVSSGGDGSDAGKEMAALQAFNPGLRFLDRRRGYVLCEVTKDEWRSDYRTVDVVTKPGGSTRSTARFTVRAGRPGIAAG